MAGGISLGERLARLTSEAAPQLVDRLDGGRVRCHACGHRCLIAPGRDGVCRVRSNRDGVLRVPAGYVAGLANDPIEKKPFFHALPGTAALSFGMLGCDLHCSYCQNWITSQALRDPGAVAPVREVTAREIVDAALRVGARTVTSTYNEPLITSEWAAEVFRLAREHGLRCAFVSNGNATPRVLDYLRPWVDFYKVDLKGFDDARYRRLGGVLAGVMETLEGLLARGFWVEVVTLVVPGFNDDPAELRAMARFLASLSLDIPWHVTAFYDNYRMRDRGATPACKLLAAAQIGREEGLNHVYAGNLPGEVGDFENTRCPACGELLIERSGFRVLQDRLSGCGRCPKCAAPVAGVWC